MKNETTKENYGKLLFKVWAPLMCAGITNAKVAKIIKLYDTSNIFIRTGKGMLSLGTSFIVFSAVSYFIDGVIGD